MRIQLRGGPPEATDWTWLESPNAPRMINEAVKGWSGDAAAVLMLLPPPAAEGGVSASRYAELLQLLCAGMLPAQT